MSGLREQVKDAITDAWDGGYREIPIDEATDAVLRVLAEHGDTQQVREQNLHEVVAEWHDRAVRAEAAFDRYRQAKQPLARAFAEACKEIADLRQQLDQARDVLARGAQTPLTRLVKAQAILDAPARPAGHDETGQ
jgi:aminoglycoside phosphotransferase family enzyme